VRRAADGGTCASAPSLDGEPIGFTLANSGLVTVRTGATDRACTQSLSEVGLTRVVSCSASDDAGATSVPIEIEVDGPCTADDAVSVQAAVAKAGCVDAYVGYGTYAAE
jgi:hypothetical protein